MKKILLILVLVIVSVFLYKGYNYFFVNEHNIIYSIKTEDNSYNINEKFVKDNDISLYTFLITDKKKKKYFFSIEKDMNKEDKLIDDIKYFKSNDLKCILPIFKNEDIDKIICEEKGFLVNYSYLNQNDNKDFKKIEKKVNELGYSFNFSDSDKTVKFKKSKVFVDNVLNGYTFTIWNYRGLDILNKNDNLSVKLFNEDKYENELAILVGDYYVYFDTNSKNYEKIYYYDFKEKEKKFYELDDVKFDDIYFNGIFNDELYITDVEYKKQYKFNPKSSELIEVGNKEVGYSFYDGKELEFIKYEDFFAKEMIFGYIEINKVSKKYDVSNIFRSGDFYYFDDGEYFYRGYIGEEGREEILFSFDKISEWKVIGRDLIVISDDILYFYNEDVGLKRIYKNNELAYNYNNICDFKRD